MIVFNFLGKLSPFVRVVISLILGIATGLFFGEVTGNLEIIGTAYIRLLQMTVLPYILVSIVGGLGRLDSYMASRIGMKALRIILTIWLTVMLTLILLPLAYPNWETAGFFSTSLLAEASEFNFVDLYIPSNIFSSLANTIVPAVVLFSLLMGISLINVKNKDSVVNISSTLSSTLMGVASFVAKLAPIGIFAISAAAAGTLAPEELGRLQVFLWVYLIAASLLAFVLLPLLIHWATPFSYRQIMAVSGEAVITALATGTVLVVLPMIIDRCKAMLKEQDMLCDETKSTVDVLVPTAYSFPSTGTLLGLGFILFSGWYVGSPIPIEQYPSYITMGALTAFGSMAVAIPFMLDFFGLPADQFQLYLLGSVVTARFATALAALHGFVVTLLVACAVMRRLKWTRVIQAIAVHLGVTAGVMILTGITLTKIIPYEYQGTKTFESMALIGEQAPIKNIKQPQILSFEEQQIPRLDLIRQRGVLRIGYFYNALPYAFRNNQADLVGYDMELMHALAKDLNLHIEYTHVNRGDEVAMLNDGRIDIMVGGNSIAPKRALNVTFSQSYTHHSAGLIVIDKLRRNFSSLEKIKKIKDLKIGVTSKGYYTDLIQSYFPNATLVKIRGVRDFFKGEYKEEVDALFYAVEAGSAWGMLYSEYTVVIPEGFKLKVPAGFILPKGQISFANYINTWINLKRENGIMDKVYDYWILGIDPKEKPPRWSIAHDVLGWDME